MTRESQTGFQLIVVSRTRQRGCGPSCRQEVLRSSSHFFHRGSVGTGEGDGSRALADSGIALSYCSV